MRRFFKPLLLLSVLAPVLAGCSRAPSDRLVVGMELAYPPFEMTDAAGAPSGISVDLARDLGAALGRPVVIENISFDGLIPALRTGKIDLILSSMTVTEERSRAVAFSDPYLQTGLAILAGKDTGIASAADLTASPGRRVAVKNGTTGHLYARDHLAAGGATVRVFDSEAAAVMEVAQGKADAFLYDQLSVLRNAERHPDTTRPLLDPFQRESWAIGLRQGQQDAALLAQVNAFLRDYRAQGGFEKLGDRYLKQEKAEFARRGVPFVF